MREILFKAKRKDNGEWEAGYYLKKIKWQRIGDEYVKDEKHYICVNMISSEDSYVDPIEVVPDTLCQYTGLTDKNGNKIWENDIVEFIGHKGNIVFECGSFGIAFQNTIEWDEIQRRILPITGCDNLLWACENDNYISLWEIMWNFNDEEDSVNTVETIGNIFDNPELLKGGVE